MDDNNQLPADIEEVWGQGKRDSTGALATATAQHLIGEWGIDAFRRSALHQMALAENARAPQARPKQAKPKK